ncbi:helix-turn-helix domain-containing protein, partial [Clostridioides difficile]|nr:helix-turn-helix domain-containing protein [Clostridioides difficile]
DKFCLCEYNKSMKFTKIKHWKVKNMKKRSLKAGRIEAGYTQEELAYKIGIAKSTYNLKENGKRNFTEKEMIMISYILNKTMDELFLEKRLT